jgi:hypothetical protein
MVPISFFFVRQMQFGMEELEAATNSQVEDTYQLFGVWGWMAFNFRRV